MIRAIMIVEMAGRPPAHVKESLKKHVELLNQVEEIEVHKIELSEPKSVEGQKDIFTCFAQIEFSSPTLAKITHLMFDYMPSSIEIVEPSKVMLDANQATDLLNNISGRLHRYDEIAKVAGLKIKELKEEIEKTKKSLKS